MSEYAVFLDQGSLSSYIEGDRIDYDISFSALESVSPNWTFYEHTSTDCVSHRINGATIVVTNKVVIDRDHIKSATQGDHRLKLVCVAATGTNNIDIESAREFDVAVCNVTGYATRSVTEHVFALMLALVRRLPEYQKAVLAGKWQRSNTFSMLDYPITSLAGRKLGIIGYGVLGRAVAQVAKAFGMQVLVAARAGVNLDANIELRTFDQLLSEVDVLTLHCPLTEETQHLIGGAELARMNSNALLINTARGGIVDEAALATALKTRQIAGAAIDVLSKEPPDDQQPLLCPDIPNLIVTPHIAWASQEARQQLVNEVAENIRAWQSAIKRNRII